MRKAGLALLFVLGFAAAGGLSAGVVAATTTTGTTSTAPVPQTIAPGVTISGIDVAEMTANQAFATVTASFARPLLLVVPRHRLAVAPARLGAMAAVRAAVKRALAAPAGTEVKLRVILNRKRTSAYLARLAKRFDRKALDAHLLLRGLRPRVTREQIVVRGGTPWWSPPNSSWAKGSKPIPPGPGNPLGTRWMGLSASGVGIHGTPDDASIGYSASHGCIRMHIPDAEWLFHHVQIGTPVVITDA